MFLHCSTLLLPASATVAAHTELYANVTVLATSVCPFVVLHILVCSLLLFYFLLLCSVVLFCSALLFCSVVLTVLL
jgi:hypothetical protein